MNLLPCPFCGKPATAVVNTNPAKVGCFNPDCTVKPKASSTCENTAERKWNQRSFSIQDIYAARKNPCDFSVGDTVSDGQITYVVTEPNKRGMAKLVNNATGETEDWNACNNRRFFKVNPVE